jgi:hypothetical protein
MMLPSSRASRTCPAAQPSLIGAENQTYNRSRLTGTSSAVGRMPVTSVVAGRSGRGRDRTAALVPSTVTV